MGDALLNRVGLLRGQIAVQMVTEAGLACSCLPNKVLAESIIIVSSYTYHILAVSC